MTTFPEEKGPDAFILGARTEQWCYNNRMQPTEVRVGAAASTNCAAQSGDLLRLGYTYWSPNNGNLQSQSIMRPSFSATQSYSFDALNRLSGVTEGSDSRTFDYSQYGNMWVATASTGWAPPSFTPREKGDRRAFTGRADRGREMRLSPFPPRLWSARTRSA